MNISNRYVFIRTITQVVLSICIIMFSGCGRNDSSKMTVRTKPLVIGYLPMIAHLPALVIAEQGSLPQMPIEYRIFSKSDDLLSALSRGDVDIATTISLSAIARRECQAISEGKEPSIKVFSFSETSSASPFDSIFVPQNSDIKNISDLIGKKIGVFPGPTAKNILGYFLHAQHGIDLASIKFVELPPNLQLNALKSADVDALYTYETVRTIAVVNGLRQLHGSVVASVLEGAPYGGSAVNSEYAKKNPEVTQQYVAAFDQAAQFVRNEQDKSRVILQKELELSTSISRGCSLEKRLTTDEMCQPLFVSKLNEFIRKLKEMGEIERSFDGSVLLYKKRPI